MALSDIFATPENEDVTPRRTFGGSDAATGAEVGLRGLQSGYYNLPLVEDPAAAAYAGAEAASVPVQFRSSEDVNFLDPSQVIDYAQQNIGQLGVSTLPTLATGGFGAAVGRRILGAAAENLTKAELARRAATIANSGRAGAVVGGTAQAYGEQAGELRDNGMEPGAFTGLTSLASGLGNVFGLENAFKSLITNAGKEAVKAGARSREASIAMGAGKGLLTTGGIETATELGDESLAIANRAWYDPKYRDNTDDMWNRAKETAISTMAGAGLMGGVSGSVGGMRSPIDTTPVPTPSPAPDAAYHDMSLDEFNQLDSSNPSTGDTYGQSQNSATQSPATDETGQRQEVLKPAGASAPATNSRSQFAFDFFQGKGLPPHIAAGIVGGLTGESSRNLSSDAVNPTSGAFGAAQWLGSRKQELKAFAEARGKPVNDFETQLEFVWHELNNKERGAFNAIMQATDASSASDLFTTKYERPGKHEQRLEPRRAAALDLLKGNPVGTTVAQKQYTPEQTAAEVGEIVRRKTADEPATQDTTLGRAIKEAQGQPLGTDLLSVEDQNAPSDEGGYQNTTEGFTLTEKGKKYESTGEDAFKPARPVPEAASNEMQAVTNESTPTRAFQIAYPGSEINVSDDKTARKVSVTFPEDQRDAMGENEKTIARAMFDAFNSGKKAGAETKIFLEHPEVLSEKSGNPIEIPVTKEKLIQLGRALDPGAFDDTPASAHAAAVSGMTHLIYDKGFQPRGKELTKIVEKEKAEKKTAPVREVVPYQTGVIAEETKAKPKAEFNPVNAWLEQQLGKAPTDNRPERAASEPEKTTRTLQPVGTKLKVDEDGKLVREISPDLEPRTKLKRGETIDVREREGKGYTPVKVTKGVTVDGFLFGIHRPLGGGKGWDATDVVSGRRIATRNTIAEVIEELESLAKVAGPRFGEVIRKAQADAAAEKRGTGRVVADGFLYAEVPKEGQMKPVPGYPVVALSYDNVGSGRMEGRAPANEAGGFTGEELSPNPEYEAAPSYTPAQQATLSVITQKAQEFLRNVGPEPEDAEGKAKWEKQKVTAWNSAIDRAVREINPTSIQLPPTSFTHEEISNSKKTRPVMLRRSDSPKFKGVIRPNTMTREFVANVAELAKKEFSNALYSRRKNEERALLNQEAGVSNNDMTSFEQDAGEDQTLNTEAELGRAEDRVQMAQRQRGLTSTFSPSQAKAQVRRSSETTTNRLDNAASKPRDIGHENLETVHKVSGGSTVRATGVSDTVVQFLTKALTDIGLQVPVRVMSRAGIQQHADALQQRIEALSTSLLELSTQLKELPELTKEQKAEKKILRDRLRLAERRLSDATAEQTMLIQAMEDSFAARVIYNDHYMDASGRAPIVIISDEALSAKNEVLTRVLGHELGHIVQRAWFDQLPADMKAEILNELSKGGVYTDDIAEAFADRFYEWYERTSRGAKIKQKQADYESTGMDKIFRQLMAALQRLWKNLTSHDRSFSRMYPKFDEFLRASIGMYGKMKPTTEVNEKARALWRESLAQPYGGLPLRVANSSEFNNMTVPELQDVINTAASNAKERTAKYAESKLGQNQVAKDYQRRLGETLDVMKTGANFMFMAEGHRLRNSWGGIFAGWGNIYAPEMGKNLGGMRVISGDLHTRGVTGRALNVLKRLRSRYNGKLENIHKQLKDLSEQEKQALLENLQNENAPPASPLAKEVRKYFRDVWTGLRAADVSVGKLKDYFPKAWDAEQFADSAKRQEIVDRFTALFKARNELPVKERIKVAYEDEEGNVRHKWHDVRYETAEAAAIDTYNRISRNEIDPFANTTNYGVEKSLRSSAFPNNRSRPFSDKEYRDHNLYDFLNKDVGYVMQMYTNQATQRMMQQMVLGIPKDQRDAKRNPKAAAAWAERFEAAGLDPVLMHTSTASLDLLLAEGIKDGRIPFDEYDRAKSLITSTLGQKNVGVSPRLRRWNNRIVAYQTILTMGWSMFSSLGDFGIAAWRGESLSRASDSFKKLLDKTTRQQQEELLKTLGLALDETTRHALQMDTAAVGDPIARFSQNLTEKFFKLNGMEFLSHSNMIFSSLLGQSYIKDYSNQAINGATQEIRDAAIDRLKKLHPEFDPTVAMANNFESDPMMQLALMEFISQSHLHDQQGYTPEYFQDHRFRLLTMLKGFTFKYHNIVLKQMWEKMKNEPDLLRATMPVVTLALATMPLALLGMETKDFLRRKMMPKVNRYKDKTGWETLHDVVMASGMPGMYVSMFDDMLEAPKHGQPGIISLMGPAVGTVYSMSARTADEYLPGMTPLVASFPWMRSKMREGLRDTFGFGVRDEEE